MKSITIIFLMAFSLGAQSQLQYQINVTIKDGMQNGKAFLRYWSDNGPYLDSVSFTKGRFTIKGDVPSKLAIARVWLINTGEKYPAFENTCEVWLETGVINIIAEKQLSNARYTGSATQNEFSELQENLRTVKQKTFLFNTAYEKAEEEKDDAKKDKLLNEDYPALFAEKQAILGKFIKKFPGSLISAFKFEEFAGEGQINLSVVEPVFESLHDSIKQHPSVKKVAELMEITRRTAPGMDALDFAQTDTSGNIVRLSYFRGKYLLIDFWAGWCMPCRRENPHLKKLYDQYKDKGFEILGVSLDGERPRWTNAIITDKLYWPQVSDLNIFENEIAKKYGITSIPQNILIGPEGKIIEWNLRGTVLDKKLEIIFNQ